MTQQQRPDVLGSIVRRYRELDLQLSQTDLAWLSDVARGTISNLETGRVSPDERTWHRIRTALALPQISPEDARRAGAARPIIPVEALQGIIAAILNIRTQSPEAGQDAAERWRRLVAKLTHNDGPQWPETNTDLTWLVRDVALMAPPQSLTAIHGAVQEWGWKAGHHIAIENGAVSASPGNREHVQQLFDTLTSSLNDIAAQLRIYHDQAQRFERLPARVQDLLSRGLVVDFDISRLGTIPGVSIIDLVVVDEDDSPLALRKDIRDVTMRWSAILKVTRFIFDRMAPDRNPQEILNAVEYGLQTQGSSEAERKLRQQARSGEPVSMYNLGKLLRKSGQSDEAELWLRRAAEVGHPGALFNLGILVQEDGRTDEAEGWLRRAAEAGHPEALYCLWNLVWESGRTDEAEGWLRRAAEAGHRDALFTLGKLVQENGQTDEAERWLRRAAEAGHSGAMSTVEIMLYEKRKRS